MTQVSVLSTAKCEELLRAAIVGRVAYATDEGPQIVPVNYTTVDRAVVFRTGQDTQLARHAVGRPLAFEIDEVDYDDHKGWSVVAVGVGELVEDTTSLEQATPFWNPKPWVDGPRTVYVRLAWTRLTGRRIGAGWTRENELPVRRR
jgi:nitroimidazol reductase NimA-like FMN-containing flavoprotein (pyridoxamine 5'-phosphate oxidase superfamily)